MTDKQVTSLLKRASLKKKIDLIIDYNLKLVVGYDEQDPGQAITSAQSKQIVATLTSNREREAFNKAIDAQNNLLKMFMNLQAQSIAARSEGVVLSSLCEKHYVYHQGVEALLDSLTHAISSTEMSPKLRKEIATNIEKEVTGSNNILRYLFSGDLIIEEESEELANDKEILTGVRVDPSIDYDAGYISLHVNTNVPPLLRDEDKDPDDDSNQFSSLDDKIRKAAVIYRGELAKAKAWEEILLEFMTEENVESPYLKKITAIVPEQSLRYSQVLNTPYFEGYTGPDDENYFFKKVRKDLEGIIPTYKNIESDQDFKKALKGAKFI